MIQEDYEEKKNLMFNNNDYIFNSKEYNYMYLHILIKVKSLKKLSFMIAHQFKYFINNFNFIVICNNKNRK